MDGRRLIDTVSLFSKLPRQVLGCSKFEYDSKSGPLVTTSDDAYCNCQNRSRVMFGNSHLVSGAKGIFNKGNVSQPA